MMTPEEEKRMELFAEGMDRAEAEVLEFKMLLSEIQDSEESVSPYYSQKIEALLKKGLQIKHNYGK